MTAITKEMLNGNTNRKRVRSPRATMASGKILLFRGVAVDSSFEATR